MINQNPEGLVVELDESCDRNFTGTVKIRYAIFSQQRTGSHLVCADLINTGRLGIPAEYYHGEVIDYFIKRVTHGPGNTMSLVDYQRHLETIRTSENGIFGAKIQPGQLKLISLNEPQRAASVLSAFNGIILLTRRNKLKQAISGVISELTRKWRNNGSEPILPDMPDDQLIEMISAKLTEYNSEERWMRTLLDNLNRPVLELSYEDYVLNRNDRLKDIHNFLGVPYTGSTLNLVDEPKKPAGTEAKRLLDLFMERNSQSGI